MKKLLVSLVLVTLTPGCSDTYNTFVTDNYFHLEDVDGDETIDTETPADTDVEDTDVTTVDPECAFTVATVENFTIVPDILQNELRMRLDFLGMDYVIENDRQEILRIKVQGVHQGCPNLAIEDMPFYIESGNVSGTNWLEELGNRMIVAHVLREDGSVGDAVMYRFNAWDRYGDGKFLEVSMTGWLLVPAETESTIVFYADTTNVPAGEYIRPQIPSSISLVVSDNVKQVRLLEESHIGHMINSP